MNFCIIILSWPVGDERFFLGYVETSHYVFGIWNFASIVFDFIEFEKSWTFVGRCTWNSIHEVVERFHVVFVWSWNKAFLLSYNFSHCLSFFLQKFPWLPHSLASSRLIPVWMIRGFVSTRRRKFFFLQSFFIKIALLHTMWTHWKSTIIYFYFMRIQSPRNDISINTFSQSTLCWHNAAPNWRHRSLHNLFEIISEPWTSQIIKVKPTLLRTLNRIGR